MPVRLITEFFRGKCRTAKRNDAAGKVWEKGKNRGGEDRPLKNLPGYQAVAEFRLLTGHDY